MRFAAPAAAAPSAEAEDAVSAVFDDCQPTALVEDPGRWQASFPTAAARDRARALLLETLGSAVSVVPFEMADDDWAARSQAEITPIRVGRIVVTPPWHAASVDRADGDHLVVVVPSMGFGTGHHATTRLCLAALQALSCPGKSVTDIGTGSGVLAMAAAYLGAARVMAIDDDPDAIEAARENVALNRLHSVVELARADFRARPMGVADIVVANLTGALLVQACGRLATTVAPGGHLVVSGFTLAEREAVVAVFDSCLPLVEERSEEEWGVAVLGGHGTRRHPAGDQTTVAGGQRSIRSNRDIVS